MDPTLKAQCAERKKERKLSDDRKAHTRKVRSETKKIANQMLGAEEDDKAVKLAMTFNQLIQRLIDESSNSDLLDVDWYDKESRDRRRAQLANIKDLMSVARGIKDVMSLLVQEEGASQEANLVNSEKVVLLEDARKALKKVGISSKGL